MLNITDDCHFDKIIFTAIDRIEKTEFQLSKDKYTILERNDLVSHVNDSS